MGQVQKEKRAFVVVLIFLGISFLFLLKPVLIPLILSVIITVLLYPLYSLFLKLFRGRAYLSSFVATFLIFLLFVLPSGLVTALFVNEAAGFAADMNLNEFFASFLTLEFYQTTLRPLIETLENRFHIAVDLASLLTGMGAEAARYVTNFSPQALVQTASFIFGFFVMHVSVFFLFIEGKGLFKTFLDLSPLKAGHEKRLTGEFKNMIYATVYGYLFTALIQGILAGVAFWIAGIKAPLVFGTLTFFMSLVPIVGAASVWAPVAAWFFLQGHWGWGLFLALYGFFLISGVDNVVKPLIMRGKAKIHILLIFFSLFGGIHLFGPIGILLGPVITALFVGCIRIYREEFLEGVRHET